MTDNQIIITIDGPSGSGKTSIASILANHYNFFHLKGGVFLRAFAYLVKKNNISLYNKRDIINLLNNLNLTLQVNNNNYDIILNDTIVTSKLWNNEIDKIVPITSNYKEVRKERKLWLHEIAKNKNIIADGRTLGSEIFPSAKIKIYLTASLDKRCKRKAKQYKENIFNISKNIISRDNIDSNALINKLAIPKDSIFIDSSLLTLNEVAEKIKEEISKKINIKSSIV